MYNEVDRGNCDKMNRISWLFSKGNVGYPQYKWQIKWWILLKKFKENKNHCLSNKNFEQMFKIISSAIMSIVEDNISDYNDGILLTNCLFHLLLGLK